MPQKSQEFLQTRKIMKDYVIMLSVPVIAAVFNYGLTAAFLILLSVITCFICKKAGEKILKTDFPSRDYSSIVIGISVALLLPATAPWWMVVFTTAFAYFVCVMPFGSSDNSPFIPAVYNIFSALLNDSTRNTIKSVATTNKKKIILFDIPDKPGYKTPQ